MKLPTQKKSEPKIKKNSNNKYKGYKRENFFLLLIAVIISYFGFVFLLKWSLLFLSVLTYLEATESQTRWMCMKLKVRTKNDMVNFPLEINWLHLHSFAFRSPFSHRNSIQFISMFTFIFPWKVADEVYLTGHGVSLPFVIATVIFIFYRKKRL